MELAVDAVVLVLQKFQILCVDRSERETLPVEQLNEKIFECSEEAIVSIVRKEFCPALKALLEHGLRETVTPIPRTSSFLSLNIGSFSAKAATHSRTINQQLNRANGEKIEHIWDIIQYFYEWSKALELRDAAVGRLSETFKLDSIDGRTATSKQILLTTIENVNSSHIKLKRSPDTMWKAFVSAALNHNRLPGWIRIIFRNEMIQARCYHSYSYVSRTGCEDIRELLEKLHEYSFDLPVDLAVRPFDHIKEAF